MAQTSSRRPPVRARTAALTLVLLGAAALASGCDQIFGFTATFVDASATDGGHPEAGTRDAVADRTTPHDAADASRDAGHDGEISDAHDASCSPNLTTDPNNCGRCGHACFPEGGCGGGMCVPTILAYPMSPTGEPVFIAVGGGKVYWTQGGSAQDPDWNNYYTSTTGGNAEPVPTRNLGNLGEPASAIVLSNGVLYLAYPSHGVYSCTAPTCEGGVAEIGTTTNQFQGTLPLFINGLAIYGRSAYVTADPNNGTQGALAVCVLEAGVSNACRVLAGSQYVAHAPAANDGGVLWLTEGPTPSADDGGTLVYCASPTSTCDATTENVIEPTLAATPQYLAINGDNAYWTEVTETGDAGPLGQVVGCPRDDCHRNLHVFATKQRNPQGIATDGVMIYWVEMGGPAILACPVSGCPDSGPIVLAAGDAGAGGAPFQLAVDEAGVYWTNRIPGAPILGVAKP